MNLAVLFEDFHLIAVNKPAGLPTQAPPGIDSLEAQVKEYIRQKYAKPAGVYLGIPHRLDRPVTGAVLFARNTKAAQRVSAQFEKRTVVKVYWALVEGTPAEPAGTWEDWLLKIPDVAQGKIVPAEEPGAKRAITGYRTVGQIGRFTWLEMLPQTGRMHQLRIQAAARGLPIVGDRLYGAQEIFDPADESRIALHARSLTIEHPFRKVPLFIEAPPDAAWTNPVGWVSALGNPPEPAAVGSAKPEPTLQD